MCPGDGDSSARCGTPPPRAGHHLTPPRRGADSPSSGVWRSPGPVFGMTPELPALEMVFVEARESVVWDLIPGRPRSDEEVEPWAYAMSPSSAPKRMATSSPSGHSPTTGKLRKASRPRSSSRGNVLEGRVRPAPSRCVQAELAEEAPASVPASSSSPNAGRSKRANAD
jgi:hypothetical protein